MMLKTLTEEEVLFSFRLPTCLQQINS